MTIQVESLDTIDEAAKQFVEAMANDTVFAFRGEMGVGKTTFIKAVCKQLGVLDSINSPSFAIVNEYYSETKGEIYHFDFYRINTIEEAYDFGYEDYLFSGKICFIEWAEKIEDLLPNDIVNLIFVENEDKTRTITILK